MRKKVRKEQKKLSHVGKERVAFSSQAEFNFIKYVESTQSTASLASFTEMRVFIRAE